jgi:dTDP-glucose 4,6-dehydratase
MYKKVLVTGAAGFIGSNFAHFFVAKYPDAKVTVVDALTYAGNKENLQPVADKIEFVEASILDEPKIDQLMEGVDLVVHFAAESHVDRSIIDPGPFLRTNVLGTEILARLALKHKVNRFHHISTDEVFGSLALEDTKIFNESTPYNPRSPYSASKAASDHIVRAYGETYGLPFTITNCSNNYGPYHFPEKVIPLFITNAIDNQPLPIYGDGKSVRDYLYVEDHVRAIDVILEKGKLGETYCVGGGAEKNGIEIAETVLKILGKPTTLMQFVKDRAGHDRRYAIDAAKIHSELGWSPQVSFEEGIQKTIEWYNKNEAWWRPLKEKAKLS